MGIIIESSKIDKKFFTIANFPVNVSAWNLLGQVQSTLLFMRICAGSVILKMTNMKYKQANANSKQSSGAHLGFDVYSRVLIIACKILPLMRMRELCVDWYISGRG